MSPSELIEHWRFRNHRVQLAHYESARRFERLHLWLGLPAIALSTLVGTTVFATLSNAADVTVQIAVGLLSVAAAVLTGLQTFLKYSELSEKHRLAGAKFANLKHRIELLVALPPSTEAELKEALISIEETWSKLREESPTLPTRVWRHIEQTVSFEEHQRRYPNFEIAPNTSIERTSDKTPNTAHVER
jgi:hypothetical protein